jgi:hypothetical protein
LRFTREEAEILSPHHPLVAIKLMVVPLFALLSAQAQHQVTETRAQWSCFMSKGRQEAILCAKMILYNANV